MFYCSTHLCLDPGDAYMHQWTQSSLVHDQAIMWVNDICCQSGPPETNFIEISITKVTVQTCVVSYIDWFVQKRHNFNALAMELLQSCTKPSIYNIYEMQQ